MQPSDAPSVEALAKAEVKANVEPAAVIAALNRLFMQALLQVGDSGDTDAACRLAAQGWSLLRHEWPREAERLNGVMHSLTGPRRTKRNQTPPSNDIAVPTQPPK